MKPLTDRVAYHTMKGRRASNQDAVVVGMMADGRGMAAVADGMGGRLGGDVASRRALEVVAERLGAGEGVTHAIREANRTIFAESGADPELHGMGTTVVALVQDGEEYHIANVGDSRAYRLSGSGITRVTADHSFTAEAVEAGDMTPEDAVHSPWANALTRAIGTDEDVEVDLFGPFDARESHAILLCSDGFHKPLSDEGILTSVLGCDPLDSAEELTDIALRAGSDDNITIALVSFGDGSWRDEAVRARLDTWEMDDAPTVEFENEADDWLDAGPDASETLAPPVDAEEDEERPPPEWIMPDEDDSKDGAETRYRDIASGSIFEGLAPIGAGEGEEGVEILARVHRAMAGHEARDMDNAEGEDPVEDGPRADAQRPVARSEASVPQEKEEESREGGSEGRDVADGSEPAGEGRGDDEEAGAGGAAESPDPLPGGMPLGVAMGSATKAARSGSRRRRRTRGFDLVVSPAKPQRRFKPKGFVTPVALLAAIGAVVALLIRFL